MFASSYRPRVVDYLYGWVVGYTLRNVSGNGKCLLERRTEFKDANNVWWPDSETVVFKTEAAARSAAKPLLADSDEVHVRKYVYSTPTPEHAKGLRLLGPGETTDPIYL